MISCCSHPALSLCAGGLSSHWPSPPPVGRKEGRTDHTLHEVPRLTPRALTGKRALRSGKPCGPAPSRDLTRSPEDAAGLSAAPEDQVQVHAPPGPQPRCKPCFPGSHLHLSPRSLSPAPRAAALATCRCLCLELRIPAPLQSPQSLLRLRLSSADSDTNGDTSTAYRMCHAFSPLF